MPSRARDRHLAKNAERRRLEKERSRRNRQAALGVGIGVLVILLVLLAIGLITQRQSEKAAASATPSTSASTSPSKPVQTGTVSATTTPPSKVACGAERPAAADKPKPQFDHAPTASQVLDPDTAYTAVIETSCGTVTIALDSQAAPATVASFVFLADHGYFDGQFFHRIDSSIDVVQGGDPTGAGTGGPGYTIPDEVTGKETYTPGTIAMANTGAPDSGGSQFFLIFGPDGHNLDSQPNYTIFGNVTEGMDVLKEIGGIPVQDPNVLAKQQPIEAVYIDKVTIEKAKAPASSSASPSA